MLGVPPTTAAALADHVNDFLGPPGLVAGHVGLMRCRSSELDIEIIAALDSIKDELPLLSRESAQGAFLSASATCAHLTTGVVAGHGSALERVRVTVAVTLCESAIVVASGDWSVRGECAIEHPFVAQLRDWAGLCDIACDDG